MRKLAVVVAILVPFCFACASLKVVPVAVPAAAPAAAPDLTPVDTPTAVANTATFTRLDGVTIVAGELELPGRGPWEVAAAERGTGLEGLFLRPSRPTYDRDVPAPAGGRRLQLHLRDEKVRQGRHQTEGGWWQDLAQYAKLHDGLGPASFTELLDLPPYPDDKEDRRRKYIQERLTRLERSPWEEDQGKDLKGPFFFLLPGVPIREGNVVVPVVGARRPLVLELRPYVDDGKHWVTFNDGVSERVAVDAALLATYGLAIDPVVREADVWTPAPQALPFKLVARLVTPPAKVVTLVATNTLTRMRVAIAWDLSSPAAGKEDLASWWIQGRAQSWLAHAAGNDAPVLARWIRGANPGSRNQLFPGQNQGPRLTDAFSFLGGRAALQETFQLQPLRAGSAGERPSPLTVPLANIKGVEVKSHPFAEMLGNRPGGKLGLARSVPADRLFVYFAKPAALFPFLDDGGDFIFRSGSLFSRSLVDDNLKGKYLARLGLSEKWGRRFIESGGVKELALMAPDLFFLDGTDVTLLMRVASISTVQPLLKLLGIVDLKMNEVTAKPLEGGGTSYWARVDDLLVVGSDRGEVESVVALTRGGGNGSLGAGAEFRYMLEQQPIGEETRAYVYFSDSFIRRLVGPAVKIGQLRRLRAQSEMTNILAAALLRRVDGKTDVPDLAVLAKEGYLPAPLAGGDYAIDPDLTVRSAAWGTLARPATLLANPVAAASEEEAEAYKGYVESYARYWRQYFDPVALRLDDAPGGALELAVYILPLLDSQLYDGLRAVLARKEAGQPLRVPVINPPPVATLSLNLDEKTWVKIAGSWARELTGYTGLDPAFFDLLGPGFHLAVKDSDPIIALGNGDLLGIFGQGAVGPNLTRQGLPIIVSILTRPCQLFIELADEKRALEMLRGAAATGWGRLFGRSPRILFSQVEGRDAWFYTISVENLVKLRFGLEIRDGFLIISNLPWSQMEESVKVATLKHNGAALSLDTGAVRLQKPALFVAAGEEDRRAALQGMAYLYPLLLALGGTPEEAADRQAALFGFRPLHPGKGKWVWKDGSLASSLYGDPLRGRMPAWRPENPDFGVFQGVERLSVNMQLEDTGLRAACRWTWKKK